MTLQRSRQLAILLGTITPGLETARRWRELVESTVWWPAYVDDLLLGGFLLVGAWWSGRDAAVGRPVLTAAWGFMCGLAYSSLAFQLGSLSAPDPSGLSPVLVVTVKAVGLGLGIAGLAGSLRPVKPKGDNDDRRTA